MRGACLLAACALAASACGGGAKAGAGSTTTSSGQTRLEIELQPKGTDGPTLHASLRCAPPRGSHPHPAAACAALARQQRPFAPTPAGVMCSALYSGPQRAHVTGSLRGVRVDARFKRSDSCETSRWTRIQAVLRIS
jgi:hypothetical protein